MNKLNLQRRDVKIAGVFIVIGILLGSIVAYAATPSSTFWISSGVYPGAPSYTVWKEGSDYFAKNANGEIDYSGTNAATVINAAIDAAPSYGTVYAIGTITITEQITVDPLKSFTFDYIIISDTDDDGVVIDGGATVAFFWNYVIGKVMKFPENYAKSAIKIRNARYVFLQIPTIFVATGLGTTDSVGIHLLGDDAGCFFNRVIAGSISGAETGVLLESNASSGFCNSNRIYDLDASACVYGVRTTSDGGDVSGNTFYSNTVNDIGNGDWGYSFNGTFPAGQQNCLNYCSTVDVVGTAIDINVVENQTIVVLGGQFVHNVTNVDPGGQLVITNAVGVMWNGTLMWHP